MRVLRWGCGWAGCSLAARTTQKKAVRGKVKRTPKPTTQRKRIKTSGSVVTIGNIEIYSTVGLP